MPTNPSIKISPLKESEIAEADRIVRLAFGTFLALPNPEQMMGDRNFLAPRWHAKHVKVLAAHDGGRLVGSNVVTRWGSFGFFGPLTVLPDYWNQGVAQRLLAGTMKIFERWGCTHTGLYTFAHSAKHVSLYQKFGYWPQYLTALMAFTPVPGAAPPELLAGKDAIAECTRLTGRILKGLDLAGEIRAVLAQKIGEIVVVRTRRVLDGFAVVMHGPGSEGGAKVCYIKFAAARGGPQFDKLLAACEAFASSRNAAIEAGVNLARQDAFQRMKARGYKIAGQGVAMLRPHGPGYNRPDVWVIDDWR